MVYKFYNYIILLIFLFKYLLQILFMIKNDIVITDIDLRYL